MSVIRRLRYWLQRGPRVYRLGPFLLTPHGEIPYDNIPHDALLVEARHEDGLWWFELPQLGIEIQDQDLHQLLDRLLDYVVDFYAALRSIPPDDLTDIEEAQLVLYAERVLPWFRDTLQRKAEPAIRQVRERFREPRLVHA